MQNSGTRSISVRKRILSKENSLNKENEGFLLGMNERGKDSKNFYEEKIKVLEEKIRKCEIEKAELDLKLAQFERKVRESGGPSSNSITKLLYIENRDLKRRLKDVNNELFQSEIEKKEAKNSHAKVVSKSLQPEKGLRELEKNLKSDKSRSDHDKVLEQFNQLKLLLKRQKIKHIKTLNTIKLVNGIKIPLIKIFRLLAKDSNQKENIKLIVNKDKVYSKLIKINTIQSQFRTSRIQQKPYFALWKNKLFGRKISIRLVKHLFRNTLKDIMKIWKNAVKTKITDEFKMKSALILNEKSLKIRKIQTFSSFRTEIFKIKNCRLIEKNEIVEHEKNLRVDELNSIVIGRKIGNFVCFLNITEKILLKRCFEVVNRMISYIKHKENLLRILWRRLERTVEITRISKFNLWKAKVSEMNINDLCLLYEEQKIEKNALLEHISSINCDESFEIKLSKQLIYLKFILRRLKKLRHTQFLERLNLWKIKVFQWQRSKSRLETLEMRFKNIEKVQKIHAFTSVITFFKNEFAKDRLKHQYLYRLTKAFLGKSKCAAMRKWRNLVSQKQKLKKMFLEKLKKKNINTINQKFQKFKQNSVELTKFSKEVQIKELGKTKENLEKKLNQAFSLMQDSNQMLDSLEKEIHKQKIKVFVNNFQKKVDFVLEDAVKTWKSTRNNKDSKKVNEKISLRLGFQLWASSCYHLDLFEQLRQERIEVLVSKVARIMYVFKRCKFANAIKIWKESVMKGKNVKNMLEIVSRRLENRNYVLKTVAFVRIVRGFENNAKKRMGNVMRNEGYRRNTNLYRGFQYLVYWNCQKKIKTIKYDCEEMIKLVEVSEIFIKEREKSIINLAKASTQKIKKVLTSRDHLKVLQTIRKTFSSWAFHYKSSKKSIKKICSLYSANIKKFVFESLKSHKAGTEQIKPIRSPKNFLFLLKILFCTFVHPVLQSKFTKWRLNPNQIPVPALSISNPSFISPIKARSIQSKSVIALYNLIQAQTKKFSSLKNSFFNWKVHSNPILPIEIPVLPYPAKQKSSPHEEVIQKLLQENLNLAYQMSSAKVHTKAFINQAEKLYTRENKENYPLTNIKP